MNPDYGQMAAALVIGAGLGFFFFGGLWLTVRRIPTSRRPQLLLLGSFVVRLAGVLAAFYALVPWGWPAMVAALAGMLFVRQVLVKLKGAPNAATSGPAASP